MYDAVVAHFHALESVLLISEGDKDKCSGAELVGGGSGSGEATGSDKRRQHQIGGRGWNMSYFLGRRRKKNVRVERLVTACWVCLP